MGEILARCGYRCDLCLAYRPNVEANPSNQQILSDGWYKYFGFRIPANEVICDGCMTDNPHLIDQGCPVRPCVINKALDNCSYCSEFDCDKLSKRLVLFEEIASRIDALISEEDRIKFIMPYENKNRLDALRSQNQ